MNGNGINGNGLHQNGNGKVLWWLIGGIITPILLTAFNSLQGNSQRITTLEANMNQLEYRLGRLETKIDQLLERR